MGLLNLFKSGISAANGRMQIFNLEQKYIETITNSNSVEQLNKSLLKLFIEMASIGWNNTSCRLFYEKNNIPVEWFNQMYIMCSFSDKNKYIKSKNKLLSNIVLIDDPEHYDSMILTIFINSLNDQGQHDIEKSSVSFLLDTAFDELM
jgi:hypothetical protein